MAQAAKAEKQQHELFTLTWELVSTDKKLFHREGREGREELGQEELRELATATEFSQATGKISAVIVHFTPAEGFYIYGNEVQEQGRPTRLGLWQSNNKSALSQVLFPPAEKKADLLNPGFQSMIYDKPVSFVLTLPGKLPRGDLTLSFSGLLCSATNCTPLEELRRIPATDFKKAASLDEATLLELLPGFAKLQPGQGAPLPRRLQTKAANVPPTTQDSFNQAKGIVITPEYYRPGLEVHSVGKAILLGFLAGFILNFMPCVLPILSIKLSALLYYSPDTDQNVRLGVFRRYCIYFALGIMSWFVALGLILLKGGLVWGQLFQYPLLVMLLTALIFALALSMFNVFTLPILDLKHSNSSSNPRLQAFSSGLLATLLATPCSGPLLGGVLGWSFQQDPMIILVVLSSVGLGMSFLYILMAIWPQLVKRLPKPGNWMEYVSKIVGFILIGSALWLLSSIPKERLMDSLLLLLLVAVACWLWGHLVTLETPTLSRYFRATLIVILVTGGFWQWSRDWHTEIEWEVFDQAVFEKSLGHEAMLITFTADWCPTCKVLERAVLDLPKVAAIKREYRLRALKVDLTDHNPEGEALLKQLGSSSIPLLAIFKTGENAASPLVIRDIYTEETLDKALRDAFDALAR